MTATELLNNLTARGVKVRPDGGKIQLTAPRGVITDADRAGVAAVKAELLELLTRPPLGSINRPLAAHGSKLRRCPFDGCGSELTTRLNIYHCGKCDWYFELLPPYPTN